MQKVEIIQGAEPFIVFPPGSDWRELAQACHLSYDRSARCWSVPATPRFCRRILDRISPDLIAENALAHIKRKAIAAIELETILALLDQARTDDALLAELAAGLTWVTKPRRHQVHTVLYGLLLARCGYYLEMGTGKTKAALDTFRILQAEGVVDRLLIIAPARLLRETWDAQATEHCGFSAQVLEGTKQAKIAAFRVSAARVVIVNYEAIRAQTARVGGKMVVKRDFGREYAAVVAEGRWMVVMDEATRVAGARNRQTTSAKRISWAADRVITLTGTPFTGQLRRLHTLSYLLDRGEALGPSWTFLLGQAERYGVTRSYFGDLLWETCPAFARWVKTRLARSYVRWEIDECVDLPPRTFRDVPVTLSRAQLRAHAAVKTGRYIELGGFAVDPDPEPIVRILRMAQITSGFVGQERELFFFEQNPKLRMLLELLGDELAASKVIIWCRYHAELDLIGAALKKAKIGFVEYSGRVKDQEEKDSAIGLFLSTASCRIFLSTIGAGSLGHTLNAATAMVFFSVGYDWEQYVQALGRNYRIGQDSPTVVFRLLAQGTIDQAIVKNLEKKGRLRDLVL